MDPNIIGREHYDIARGVQKILQDYKSLQDIIAILGKILNDTLYLNPSILTNLCFFLPFLRYGRVV